MALLGSFFLSSNAQFTLSLGGHTISILRGFDPSSEYFLCFPHKQIPGWFKNQSIGPKLKIQLHRNLHNIKYSLGFVICAAFTVHEHTKVMADNMGAEENVSLLCRFRIVNEECDLIPTLHLAKEEFTWKHLCGFIWLIYLPCNLYAESLKQESCIEIQVSSDCPDLEVLKCGIRLLNGQDVEEFKKTIEMCFTSFFDDLDPIRQFLKDKTCIKLCHFDKSETNETGSSSVDPTHGTNNLSENTGLSSQWTQQPVPGHNSQFPDKMENLDFSLDSIYNLCFSHTEILDWFRHHGNGPSVTIQIPQNLHTEVGNWIGLALCAYFSELDPQHPNTSIEGMEMETSHHLISHIQSERIGLEHPHIYRTTNDEFKWLKHGGQFLWLSYIPRKWFSHDHLNQCGSMEVSFASDVGSLRVHKCGLRLVYRHDEDELKQAIMKCKTSSLFEHEDHLLAGSENSSKFDPHRERLEGMNDLNIKDKGKRVLE